MTATVVTHTNDTLVLDIEHHPAQSWSRAVDPMAFRTARQHIRGGDVWAMTDSEYSLSAPEGRSRSRYTFENTHGVGRA